MNDSLTIRLDELVDEIVRYLGVVDVFRAAGCEPQWRPEVGAVAIERVDERPITQIETSAH
jgi:hypothetical protein